jgi:hypothetical protein
VCSVCLRYICLLEASALVPAACGSVKSCAELQSHCTASTDWRFRFGVVGVLLDVIRSSQDPGVRTAALRGFRVKGEYGVVDGEPETAGPDRLCGVRCVPMTIA